MDIKLLIAKKVWGFNPNAPTGSVYERYRSMLSNKKANRREVKRFNSVFANARRILAQQQSKQQNDN